MLVWMISYLVSIYWALTTCLMYLISFDLCNTLWETHYYNLHFQDEKIEISHKDNSLCSMASGFQEQGKPSLSIPWEEENTLLIFQIVISHVPLTSRYLSTHPRSSWFPLVSHCTSSCACTAPPAYHSLAAFSQGMCFCIKHWEWAHLSFYLQLAFTFPFLPTCRNFTVLWI